MGPAVAATIVVGRPGLATAQNCEAMASGMARTDCFIGQARIQEQQSHVVAGTARRRTDIEILRNKTGTTHTLTIRGRRLKQRK